MTSSLLLVRTLILVEAGKHNQRLLVAYLVNSTQVGQP